MAKNIYTLLTGIDEYNTTSISPTSTLSDAIVERPIYFNLTYNQSNKNWLIDGGTVQGISPISNYGYTLLAIFPVGSNITQLHQLDSALGEAQITKVLPQQSQVEIISGEEKISLKESYLAVVINQPLTSLKVYFQGEKIGIEFAQIAWEISKYIIQVNTALDADYHLLASNGQYLITHPVDGRLLVDPIPANPHPSGYTLEDATLAIWRLEHIARWHNILQLASPAISIIQPDDVEMEIIILAGNQEISSASEIRVVYTAENYGWQFPIIQIKLTNHSHRPLYCNVLDLSESYVVDVPFFESKTSIRLAAKGEDSSSTVVSFDNLGFIVPDIYWQQGRTEYKDIFKLIVSTTEFDASLLEQDGLNPPPATYFSGEKSGTLDRLLLAINSREAVRASGNYDDWLTKSVTLTVVRPQVAQLIIPQQYTTLQNGLVVVQPHPNFSARINLTTASQTSKDLENLLLPEIFKQISAFQFTNSRGSDPGLSILELSDIVDYTVITPESPLKLLVNTTLSENEYLLPIAYDGQFFLPLGRGEKTDVSKIEITLNRLTQPLVSSYSIHGIVNIFLAKVTHQKREHPILAIAQVAEDNLVTYEKNQEQVRAQVAKAKRIILYIHGIIGNTANMLSSINQTLVKIDDQKLPIKELYDLVLTFDYENVQTTIAENAQLLQQSLQAVGLGANHGKELHIVAHSTGGLLSRWFIEKTDGNQVVQHLVMLGTPNAGLHWKQIENWGLTTLSIGLNQLTKSIWHPQIFADLVYHLETDNTLITQIQSDSQLIQEFANNPDPHVPYTIIIGDSSLELELPFPLIEELTYRLFGKVVDLTFFQQPNDIAVTIASIKNISNQRTPQPIILQPDAACDHFTYFTDKPGLAALAKAIQPFVYRRVNISQEPLPSPWEMNSPHEPLPTTSDSNDEERENPTGGNSSTLITIIGLLIIVIAGLIIWKRSPQPQNHQKNSQLPFGELIIKNTNYKF